MSLVDFNTVDISKKHDTPPATFIKLQVQQGQINWLLQALCAVNDAAGAASGDISFTIGTVTTLDAGANATVTLTKSNDTYVLDFGIPEGERGAQGMRGEQGAAGIGIDSLAWGTGLEYDASNMKVNAVLATNTQPGVVKVGDNLSVSEDGTLNATAGGTAYVAGEGISIADNTISLKVLEGGGLAYDENGNLYVETTPEVEISDLFLVD